MPRPPDVPIRPAPPKYPPKQKKTSDPTPQYATAVLAMVDDPSNPTVATVYINNTLPPDDGYSIPSNIGVTFKEAPNPFANPPVGIAYYNNTTTLDGGSNVTVDIVNKILVHIDQGVSNAAPTNPSDLFQYIRHDGAYNNTGNFQNPGPIDNNQLITGAINVTPNITAGSLSKSAEGTSGTTDFTGSFTTDAVGTNATSWLKKIYLVASVSGQNKWGLYGMINPNSSGSYTGTWSGLGSGTNTYDLGIVYEGLKNELSNIKPIWTNQLPNPLLLNMPAGASVGFTGTPTTDVWVPGKPGTNPAFYTQVMISVDNWNLSESTNPDTNEWAYYVTAYARVTGQTAWQPFPQAPGYGVGKTNGNLMSVVVGPLTNGYNYDIAFLMSDINGNVSNGGTPVVLVTNVAANSTFIPTSVLQAMPSSIKTNGPTITSASASARTVGKGLRQDIDFTFTESDFTSTYPDWIEGMYAVVRINGATRLSTQKLIDYQSSTNGTYSTSVMAPPGDEVDIGIFYKDIAGNVSATVWPAGLSAQTDPYGDFIDITDSDRGILHTRSSQGTRTAIATNGDVQNLGGVAHGEITPIANLMPAEAGAEKTTGKSLTVLTDLNVDHLAEGTTNKFFSGKTLDDLPDKSGGTYKRMPAANMDSNKRAIIDFNTTHLNQGTLSKKNSVDLATSDVVNKTADNITYTGGATVDSLKPAESGAEKTTGKSITVLTDRLASNIAYGDGTAVEALKPAAAGADVTADNTAYDTSNVWGTPANVVQDGANRASQVIDSDFNLLASQFAGQTKLMTSGPYVGLLQMTTAALQSTGGHVLKAGQYLWQEWVAWWPPGGNGFGHGPAFLDDNGNYFTADAFNGNGGLYYNNGTTQTVGGLANNVANNGAPHHFKMGIAYVSGSNPSAVWQVVVYIDDVLVYSGTYTGNFVGKVYPGFKADAANAIYFRDFRISVGPMPYEQHAPAVTNTVDKNGALKSSGSLKVNIPNSTAWQTDIVLHWSSSGTSPNITMTFWYDNGTASTPCYIYLPDGSTIDMGYTTSGSGTTLAGVTSGTPIYVLAYWTNDSMTFQASKTAFNQSQVNAAYADGGYIAINATTQASSSISGGGTGSHVGGGINQHNNF